MQAISAAAASLATSYVSLCALRLSALGIGRLGGRFIQFGHQTSSSSEIPLDSFHLHLPLTSSENDPDNNTNSQYDLSIFGVMPDQEDHLFVHFCCCFGLPFRHTSSTSSFKLNLDNFVTSSWLSVLQLIIWCLAIAGGLAALFAEQTSLFSTNQSASFFNLSSSFSTQIILLILWVTTLTYTGKNCWQHIYNPSSLSSFPTYHRVLFAVSKQQGRHCVVGCILGALFLSISRALVSGTLSAAISSSWPARPTLVDFTFHIMLCVILALFSLVAQGLKKFLNPLKNMVAHHPSSVPSPPSPQEALRAFLYAKQSIVRVCEAWQSGITLLIAGLVVNGVDFGVMLLTDSIAFTHSAAELYYLAFLNMLITVQTLLALRMTSASYSRHIIGADWCALEKKWAIQMEASRGSGIHVVPSPHSNKNNDTVILFQDVTSITQLLNAQQLSATVYGFSVTTETVVKIIGTLFSVFFALWKITQK